MTDEKGSIGLNENFAHDDPSTRIWSSYLSHAEKLDRNLAQSWKGDMDSLLIFAGLFSASVTAFIIESYKNLSPNPSDTTNALLAQISQQLATMSLITNDASLRPMNSTPGPFEPLTSVLICNTLWFLSLGFSLACALSATLVEQWVRSYLQATEESHLTSHERARICAYLYRGLEKFKMAALVEAIPMLLHMSLLLFFLGLVEFLRPVNAVISYLTLGMLVACVTLYVLATFLPIFYRDCPYHTPLSSVWWKILKTLRVLWQQDLKGSVTIISGSMASACEVEAIQISSERDDRDLMAMTWTLKNLRDDSEFEAFVEVIPRAVTGHDYSAKLLLYRLHYHKDPSARLGYLIPRLLISCTGGVLDPAVSQRRATTCLAAIWSLSMMAVQTNSWETQTSVEPAENGRFNELTLRDIQTVRSEIPAIGDFAISAASVIARNLLDTYLDQVLNQEFLLKQFIDSRGESDLEYTQESNQKAPRAPYFDDPQRVLVGIHRNLKRLEGVLVSVNETVVPNLKTFLLISTTYTKISTLLGDISNSPPNMDTQNLTLQVLTFLRRLRAGLNQAGFSLLADYTSTFGRKRALPYQAFKTLRRLFMKLDLDQHVYSGTQARFVACLDDTLDAEGGTRVPESIVNILLSLARALKDPTCALKAKAVINRGMRFLPSEGEAKKALELLEQALPHSRPTLDLFTSHLYSDVKVDKAETGLGGIHDSNVWGMYDTI